MVEGDRAHLPSYVSGRSILPVSVLPKCSSARTLLLPCSLLYLLSLTGAWLLLLAWPGRVRRLTERGGHAEELEHGSLNKDDGDVS